MAAPSAFSGIKSLNLLPSTKKIIADHNGIRRSSMGTIRCKTVNLSVPLNCLSKPPKWNYDGSSTGQVPGEDSEVIPFPQAISEDSFRRIGNNISVITDAYPLPGEAIPTKKHYNAAKILGQLCVVAEEPWYGIEQEYTLLQKNVKVPVGRPHSDYPGPQGPYYCGMGADKTLGRDVLNAHYFLDSQSIRESAGVRAPVDPKSWYGIEPEYYTLDVNWAIGDYPGLEIDKEHRNPSLPQVGVYDVFVVAGGVAQKTSVCLISQVLTFTDENHNGVTIVHNRPLVIVGEIADLRLRGVLVDTGSAVNVLTLDALSGLKISLEKLEPADTRLHGFGGATIIPEGAIELPVKLGTYPACLEITTKFIVVNQALGHNAIYGLPLLNAARAIVSTYHQVMIFPTSEGTGRVIGDRSSTTRSYVDSVQVKNVGSMMVVN